MNDFLFVCSFNQLRSPTAEHVARMLGFTADSCGTEFGATRPLTLDAVTRAHRIICMEEHHARKVRHLAGNLKIEIWNIPDDYSYCDSHLIEIIKTKLQEKKDVAAEGSDA